MLPTFHCICVSLQYSQSYNSPDSAFNVHVAAFCVGHVDCRPLCACTGLSKLAGVDASEEEVSRMIAKEVPLGVVGAKWDIGIATVFLCSPAARYITGPPSPFWQTAPCAASHRTSWQPSCRSSCIDSLCVGIWSHRVCWSGVCVMQRCCIEGRCTPFGPHTTGLPYRRPIHWE